MHPFDERQRAFLRMDGCAENLCALKTMIHVSKSKLRELHIGHVDISGTFENVSHDAVLRAISTAGAPKDFVEFMAEEYSSMSTVLCYGRQYSVKCCR